MQVCKGTLLNKKTFYFEVFYFLTLIISCDLKFVLGSIVSMFMLGLQIVLLEMKQNLIANNSHNCGK